MCIKERVKELCNLNNISMNKLEETLEFGKGYISKLGSSTPNTAKIKKIADYFNVSIDYLMTGEEKRATNKIKQLSKQAQVIAAHFDGDEYTEDELEEIMNFAEFVKRRRK